MKFRWLAGILATFIAGNLGVCADGIPLDPLPVSATSAILPTAPKLQPDRPSQLPNIDPGMDFPSLDQPPTGGNSSPARPRRNGLPSSYDPSYLYLPDRNPGLRQPPCPCLPLGTWWIEGSYFLGKARSDSAPPLFTQGGSGVLGAQGVSVPQGNQPIDQPFSSGLRLNAGTWMDRCQTWGVEGSFFYMNSNRTTLDISSVGDPTLARPFIQQPGNIAAADLIASPGTSRGAVSVDSPLSFIGADINGRVNVFCEDRVRIDFVSGYRFIALTEGLTVHSYSDVYGGPAAGSTTEIQDSFHTQNLFNGGQIGLAGEYRFDRIYLSGSMKTAFGMNWYDLQVNGWTRSQAANGASTFRQSGFLAQSSNSGSVSDYRLAVVPEANFNVGYQMTDHWRLSVGYTFIFISSVARPGQAVDLNSGTAIGGAIHPAITNPNTDFWMQGVNFSLEARF